MRSIRFASGFALAGLLMVASGAGAVQGKDFGDTYRNIIDSDAFVQGLADQRTSDAFYQNIITRDAFLRDLAEQRASDAVYRNIINSTGFEQALTDGHELPYRNVFSPERFLTVLGDQCLAEGDASGPVIFAQCEVR